MGIKRWMCIVEASANASIANYVTANRSWLQYETQFRGTAFIEKNKLRHTFVSMLDNTEPLHRPGYLIQRLGCLSLNVVHHRFKYTLC